MKRTVGSTSIELLQGNIVHQEVDAIVNAANRTLLGGGGVDGAIHASGGGQILAECKTLGGCETGDAKITTGGRLPARHVIHTVGPVYSGAVEDAELLASCYRRSLQVAEEHGLTSVAFPSISTGAYGYPVEEAAEVAIGAALGYISAGTRIGLVRFVLFDRRSHNVYEQALADRLPQE